jgi:hypothetical protein
MRLRSRLGSELIDEYGNNATLLFPQYNKIATNLPLYFSDNGLLDINNSDGFTLCGWVNSKTTDKTSIRVFFGKGISGTTAGSYHIGSNITTGYLYAALRTSIGAFSVESNIDATTGGRKFLRMSFNKTTHVLKFFINEIQIGSDLTISGTIPDLPNQYKFVIGGANNGVGTTLSSYVGIAEISEVKVYPFELTPEQGSILFNEGYISGAIAEYSLAGNGVDCSGNNYHLSGTENYVYSETGSKRMLDRGYSVWTREDSREMFIPFKSDNTVISLPGLPDGYVKYKDFYPTTDGINLFPWIVRINSIDWDKSDATKFNIFARNSIYYNATHPTEWHSSELNQFSINNLCLTSHLGKIFVKGYVNSINIHDKILEIFSYATQKIGSSYNQALQYTHDYSVMPSIAIDYYYSDTHYAAIRDNKILAFNDITGELSLSLDGGETFATTKASNLTTIAFAWIFANGNIMFFDETKAYYSDDNLTTFQESTVLGIDGNAFIPTSNDNFTPFTDNIPVIISGVEHKAFGNYTVNANTEYVNINVWHTLDGGKTINSIYKAGTTLTPEVVKSARHIHSLIWNPINSTYLLQTGDDINECNWIECSSIDNFTNSFIWNVIKSGTNTDYSKSTGGGFSPTAFYWMGDVTAYTNKNGIYKSSFIHISEEMYYKQVFSTKLNGGNMYGANGVYIGVFAGFKGLVISKDGINFHIITLTGGPDVSLITTRSPYIQITSPNSDGYHKLTINETTEIPYITAVVKGVVLMLKIT